MRVLILGGGGREHAIAWKLRQDDPTVDIFAAPGNPGMAGLGRCFRLDPTDGAAVAALASTLRVDLVMVGPEAPLAAGVADACRSTGLAVFGPGRAASRLESSKRFAKELMLRAGVPTAPASFHADHRSALAAVRATGAPVVVKASGLAAGKGVAVCDTVAEAEHALEHIMLRHGFGEAGDEVLIEAFMQGEELSVFAITDGEHFVVLPSSQDHKRLGDGDTGPNTGGMGAYSPASIASEQVLGAVSDAVIEPVLMEMRRLGTPFSGLLYAGIMLTEDGPMVVEFNCRFGDPETQVVLPVLSSDLHPYLVGASQPDGLRGSRQPGLRDVFAVGTVVAASGYPDSPRSGDPVVLPPDSEHLIVFHAGTRLGAGGELESAGGRVATVVGIGSTIVEAQRASQRGAQAVVLRGAQYRQDIAWRELARSA